MSGGALPRAVGEVSALEWGLGLEVYKVLLLMLLAHIFSRLSLLLVLLEYQTCSGLPTSGVVCPCVSMQVCIGCDFRRYVAVLKTLFTTRGESSRRCMQRTLI